MDTKKRASFNLRSRLRSRYIQILYASLIITLIILFFWPLITTTVRAGEAGVLWQRFAGGVKLNHIYGEGVHFIFPWDRMTVYNIRKQTYSYTLNALSQNGLPLQLDVMIRYSPDRSVLPYLHKEIGTNYLNAIIIPEVSSALRAQVGVLREDQIYANRLANVNSAADQVIWDAQKYYIFLDAIRLTRVQLPDEIVQAIRKKMVEKEKLNTYKYLIEQAQKEAERLAIQSSALSNYNSTLQQSLTSEIIQWKGIEATRELATSQNAKIVIMGNGKQGLPVILNATDSEPPVLSALPEPAPAKPVDALSDLSENPKMKDESP